jgi:leucine dehydrogenase
MYSELPPPIASSEELFDYAKKLEFGDLHIKFDEKSGLQAIVAIHNTKRGPALGGCRYRAYETPFAAIEDAMRLAQGMSYKAAMAGLNLGGGKAVLIKTPQQKDRTALFTAFGKFVDELGGRYITAVDSGTSSEDMDLIAEYTDHVTTLAKNNGDPSPTTATGVRQALEATVKFKLQRDDLRDLRIAIQGVGRVGGFLAKELHERGAKLIISDTNEDLLKHFQTEFNATVVNPEQIYQVDCDIFSPCAMGAILNDHTIPLLKAKMIVGAANNQLSEPRHGKLLTERDILYAPDYVVNSGGLIHASAEYYKTPENIMHEQLKNIYRATLDIFEHSRKENLPTSEVADMIAREKISRS